MLKLKFTGANGTIYAYFAKAFIRDFDGTITTFSETKNTGVVVYENPRSIWEQIKDVPNYTDFTKDGQSIIREYTYVNNSALLLKIRFQRYYSTGKNDNVSKWGVAGVKCSAELYYKPKNFIYNATIDQGYPTDVIPLNCSDETGSGIWAYDIVNDVIMALNSPTRIVSKDNLYSNKHYYSGSREPWGKTSFTYKLYPFPPKLNLGDVVERNPLREHEKLYDNIPSFLSLLSADDKKGYPDGDDDPEFPDGDGDDDSDDIDPNPIFPTTPTGFVTMYNPNTSQLNSLASFMWSKDFVDVFLKLMQNPYEAIISLKTVCCDIATGGSQNIILGNVDTKISCTKITQQYQQVDCGTINITRYFGNFLDFNPYTSIKVYLPFVGFRELDVDEVMGASLHLYYNIDLLTGSCVALINVHKKIGGTDLNSVLYQFDGMIATDIPITAADYSQVVSAVIKGVASVGASIGIAAATGGTGAPASGAILGSAVASETTTAVGTAVAVNSAIDMVSSKITVQHGGNLSGSMGALATKKPYIIIQRVIPKNPSNYAKLHGIPSNAYKKLSSLKGFTKMQDIQIKSTIGSVDETEEIKQLLIGGVVI